MAAVVHNSYKNQSLNSPLQLSLEKYFLGQVLLRGKINFYKEQNEDNTKSLPPDITRTFFVKFTLNIY